MLANEEVIDGKSEVGGFPVVRKPMRQWMLRITAYAERLLADLDTIDWSDSLKEMQRNWIGRSEGAEVDFQVVGIGSPDANHASSPRGPTRFSARPTWCCRRNTSSWTQITTPEQQRSRRQATETFAASKSDLERTELAKEKTGVFTGAYAINPVNGEKIPIWIADYVLASYGTGAIMAVPAHDTRDFEFATKFNLPDRPGRPTARSEDTDWHGFVDDGIFGEFDRPGNFHRPACPPPKPKRKSPPGSNRKVSARRPSTTSCATGCSAGSATGASRSRSSGRRTPPAICITKRLPESRVAAAAAAARRLQAHARRPAAARPREGLGESARRLARARPTPCRNGPAVAGITSATSTRRTQQSSCGNEAERYWMGAAAANLRHLQIRKLRQCPHHARRGFLRRRHRARRAAPALRALLAQGAVRSRPRLDARAVLQARQPGTDPRRGRPEDVEVARQRREPGRHPGGVSAPMRSGFTKCSWARSRW